jgi:hypothetical protein
VIKILSFGRYASMSLMKWRTDSGAIFIVLYDKPIRLSFGQIPTSKILIPSEAHEFTLGVFRP